ncbi:protein STICHEL-like 3 [Impatiens glandulifera]|uniref:protein STICHEL-like 3 n=1 Tax=Impatiens glandulifera TaxID=253017 RepID=UPI001FB1A16F|nr:protein STICHEL-like 3 [Impatiens glandulifera]
MTKPFNPRILKDSNGGCDHLRNHVHLTNCIHLKNHMHKQSPSDRSLIRRELVLLQRSRSLRDPSTSPPHPSWHHSPFGFDSIPVNARRSYETKQHDFVFESISAKSVAAADDDDNEPEIIFPGPKRVKSRNRRIRDDYPDFSSPNEEEEEEEDNVKRGPRNGCGIPWNWSRIHDRGKTFLDMAGKSLSCGLSDSKSKRNDPVNLLRMMSDNPSSSSIKSKVGEAATPLLVQNWVHDYSGELGLFVDSLLKSSESDLDNSSTSEPRYGNHQKHHKFKTHQNLTQKYSPRTFQNLIGQNLAVQALSNAITKRKVGFLYVFHGPHGTGKTSTARIFARALNCQSQTKPCGVCDSCVSYDMGKNRDITEVGPVSRFDFDTVIDQLDSSVVSRSKYKVLIFDDCDSMSAYCWSVVSKLVDRAHTRRLVFILVCSSLDVLPHAIVSRCQKFYFPKIKDSDIVYALQWISDKEDLDIERDAIKLIASGSDGSLRDAEMTLDQLSLLGEKISVTLVQDLIGLISDEKLVDLLDLALSADTTTNTVKKLREIMETGVEPLALMSQLATLITDILAGGYDIIVKDKARRNFFCQQTLLKDDMERLRRALKTLSEAEKQLRRVSNDRLTWLTAALLQLAPDQQDYMIPPRKSDEIQPQKIKEGGSNGRRRRSASDSAARKQLSDMVMENREIEEIWVKVLDRIQINSLKVFMYQEGKLVSFSFDAAAPSVELMFNSQIAKAKAEKYRSYILQTFEYVLNTQVVLQISCCQLPPKEEASSQRSMNKEKDGLLLTQGSSRSSSHGKTRSEIVEIGSESEPNDVKLKEGNQSQSIVRSRVSLAHVLQQDEGGGSRQVNNCWSKRKAVSIAEKLEQQNMKLEPRSRSLLCWKESGVTRRKFSGIRIRRKQSQTLMRFVSCGKCFAENSPKVKREIVVYSSRD